MISAKRLIASCDIEKCVRELVELHRVHYIEPGYILASQSLYEKYIKFINEIISIYNTGMLITETETVNCIYNAEHKIYQLTIYKESLRDWVQSSSISKIASLQFEYPKSLSKEQLLLEVIFELTYYEFIENQLNS